MFSLKLADVLLTLSHLAEGWKCSLDTQKVKVSFINHAKQRNEKRELDDLYLECLFWKLCCLFDMLFLSCLMVFGKN